MELVCVGVATSNHHTFTESSCAQTLYAMKILQADDTIDAVQQQVYRSVILSKLQ